MRPFPPRGTFAGGDPLKQASLVLIAAVAVAACVQFPDDPVEPTPTPDAWQSPWQQDGGDSVKLIKPIADGHFSPDGGAPAPDAWVPPDTWPPMYDTGGPAPTGNSGAICSPPYGCVTGVENCLALGTSSSKGMCLGKCNSPGGVCPVANAATQFAACALQASPTEIYCVYFCAVPGQTFACPDSVNYSCEAPDPTQPSMKICVPK